MTSKKKRVKFLDLAGVEEAEMDARLSDWGRESCHE